MLRTEEAAPAGLLLEAAAVCTAAVPLLRAAEGSMAAVPFMQEEAASMWAAPVMPEEEPTWAAPVMTMDIIAGALFTGVGERMLAEEAFTAGVPLLRAAEAALLEGGATLLDALAVCGAGRLSRA
jgi:hypothetical protein